MTTTSTTSRTSPTGIDALLEEVEGPVLLPGDAGFEDEVFAFNVATRHAPAVVVGATSARDVCAAVRFAAQAGLPVAVQATGHGAVAAADGAVLVTTRRLGACTVDVAARTARVEAGTIMRTLIETAASVGLAPLAGSST